MVDAPTLPDRVSVPDELLWRIDRYLIMLRHVLVSGEVRAEVERDREAVFRLLTEPGQ